MITNCPKKSQYKYGCKKCDYYTNNKKDYNKHLQTKKHNVDKCLQDVDNKIPFICECGKSYSYRQSLSRHKKKCSYVPSQHEEAEDVNYENVDFKELVIDLLQTNKELHETLIQQQNQLIEIAKEPKTVIKTQNNNTFNLNNFLNVECKDAMNLSEFIENLQYTFNDLIHLGNNGFIKSVQNTFVKELTNMDQTKRPIHCTDKKRKTMYVKDENKWEKDNGHKKIASAIKRVNKKQLQSFSQHSKERPKDYLDSDSNMNTQHKIIKEMCGYTNDTCDVVNDKIIRNMCSTLNIDK